MNDLKKTAIILRGGRFLKIFSKHVDMGIKRCNLNRQLRSISPFFDISKYVLLKAK